ncbi:MAG: helix-turn-helix domain-containing protein [Bacteroidota bacterium]
MSHQILLSINLNEFEKLQRSWMREEAQKAVESILPKIGGESANLPEFLTRKQAAKLLNISLGTLDTWSKEGRVIKVRSGKIVRYRKVDLLANFKSLTESRYSRN